MKRKQDLNCLECVAAEHVTLEHLSKSESSPRLRAIFEDLTSLALLAKVTQLRGDSEELQQELGSALNKVNFVTIEKTLEQCGVSDAVSEHGETIFGEFRSSAIPREDLIFLRRAGFDDPECTVALLESKARQLQLAAKSPDDLTVKAICSSAKKALNKAGSDLTGQDSRSKTAPKKPRKWFKGISRVLAGGAGAAGNVMLGMGTIAAAGPIGAAAVLGSCTGALVLMGDGIESLRGND